MYCKNCGEEINPIKDGELNHELEKGIHLLCSVKLRYCNYCGKQETKDNTHFMMNNLVFCQANKTDCAQSFIDENKTVAFQKYVHLFPFFNKNLQETFLNLIGENDDYGYGEDVDKDELISDIKTHKGYIVVYHDSDGRMWYKTIPDNIEVLKYILDSEDGVSLGMGCNQYIECVIYQETQFDTNNL